MKRFLVVLATLLVLTAVLLAGCGTSQGISSQDTGSAEDAQASYRETELDLFAEAEDVPEKVAVRFYDDAPSVPYIGLAHYMSLVFGDEAKVEAADGVATITSTDGGVAVVNDTEDTLTSDSWSTFHNYLEPMQQGKRRGYVDFATPFCRVASLDYDEQAEPLAFDFSKYDIDLHVDVDDAYLPLATASDLMADAAFNNLAYNGRALCLLRGFGANPAELDSTWYESVAADEPREQDMVDFTYGELCFVVDTMYSCSGKGILDGQIANKGLDVTLSQTDEVTQRVRELLKSTDKAEYLVGLSYLGDYVTNGHTYLLDDALTGVLGEDLSERMDAISKELGAAFSKKEYASKTSVIEPIASHEAAAQRSQIWTDGASYHEKGDTAVISVDSFLAYDREG